MSALDAAFERIFSFWRSTGPGSDGIALLERVLANSFELPAPLAVELEEDKRELLQLTEQQYRILDTLARQPRAAIAGCAGSGKTFLAAEKARRLARQGFRVLVLCFNTLLARHLRRGLQDVDEIEAYSFDELCYRTIREAGIDFPEHPTPGEEAATTRACATRSPTACSTSRAGGTERSWSTRHRTSIPIGGRHYSSCWKIPTTARSTSSTTTISGSFRCRRGCRASSRSSSSPSTAGTRRR